MKPKIENRGEYTVMRIINSEEIDDWLFDRAGRQGHLCSSIKGVGPDGEVINIAWRDDNNGDIIEVIYED